MEDNMISSFYKCKENDNLIKIFKDDNGGLEEIHVSNCIAQEWIVVGADDLMKAIGAVSEEG